MSKDERESWFSLRLSDTGWGGQSYLLVLIPMAMSRQPSRQQCLHRADPRSLFNREYACRFSLSLLQPNTGFVDDVLSKTHLRVVETRFVTQRKQGGTTVIDQLCFFRTQQVSLHPKKLQRFERLLLSWLERATPHHDDLAEREKVAKKLCAQDNGFLSAESTFMVEECHRHPKRRPGGEKCREGKQHDEVIHDDSRNVATTLNCVVPCRFFLSQLA